MKRDAGFTLIELMVSAGLASVIVISSLSFLVSSMRTMTSFQARSYLTQDAIMLADYFSAEMQNVGGGPVRPWVAAWVEDNCAQRGPFPACQGSDRATVAYLVNDLDLCQVKSALAGSIDIDDSTGCCLTGKPFLNKQIVMTLNFAYRQNYVTAVDEANCRLTVAPGPMAGNNSTPAPVGWAGAMVSMVNVRTYFRDPANNQLRVFVDRNNDQNIAADEVRIAAGDIYDFQAALGYDFSPEDGVAMDGKSDTDEWLYNASGVVEQLGQGSLAGATPAALRMMSIGVLIGARDVEIPTGQVSRVLNGPGRTSDGMRLEAVVSKAMLRNTFLFQ